jgi:hypothetical protein
VSERGDTFVKLSGSKGQVEVETPRSGVVDVRIGGFIAGAGVDGP